MARRARPSSSRARDRERALDPPPPLGENGRRGGARRAPRERSRAARGRPARELPLDPVARDRHADPVRPARRDRARARPPRQAPGRGRRPRALPPPLRLLGRPLRTPARSYEPVGKRRARGRPRGAWQAARRGGRAGRGPRRRQFEGAGAGFPRAGRGRGEDPQRALARGPRRLRARARRPEPALVTRLARRRARDPLAAQLSPGHEHRHALRAAFVRVAEEEPRARLLLAGDTGPMRPSLERWPRRCSSRTASRSIACTQEICRRSWRPPTSSVSIANSDSTPPSLLEAMASGRAMVCADAASIDEWVGPGEGAEIVPVRDKPATAAAVLRLLRDDRYAGRTASATSASCARPSATQAPSSTASTASWWPREGPRPRLRRRRLRARQRPPRPRGSCRRSHASRPRAPSGRCARRFPR